jgi:hypothetical protein
MYDRHDTQQANKPGKRSLITALMVVAALWLSAPPKTVQADTWCNEADDADCDHFCAVHNYEYYCCLQSGQGIDCSCYHEPGNCGI